MTPDRPLLYTSSLTIPGNGILQSTCRGWQVGTLPGGVQTVYFRFFRQATVPAASAVLSMFSASLRVSALVNA